MRLRVKQYDRISIPSKSVVQLAEYIYRNLAFAEHVALMGLENIGYAPRNMDSLWIDPHDYQQQLEAAVELLSTRGKTFTPLNPRRMVHHAAIPGTSTH